jgi:hypothetical protein
LASAARLASLQAGRLEALDSEVVKLQSLLALVGKHIKAGAQQHQVGLCGKGGGGHCGYFSGSTK